MAERAYESNLKIIKTAFYNMCDSHSPEKVQKWKGVMQNSIELCLDLVGKVYVTKEEIENERAFLDRARNLGLTASKVMEGLACEEKVVV
jgi:hypothetical protein